MAPAGTRVAARAGGSISKVSSAVRAGAHLPPYGAAKAGPNALPVHRVGFTQRYDA